jgi:hypothetical protein
MTQIPTRPEALAAISAAGERSCNKENMLKLVTALESGEYKQGHYRLRTEDGWCCLGVASDLAAKEGVGTWQPYLPEPGWLTFVDAGTPKRGGLRSVNHDHASPTVLTVGVSKWLGRSAADAGPGDHGLLFSDVRYGELSGAQLNDGWADHGPESLIQIAARIRKEYGLPERSGA